METTSKYSHKKYKCSVCGHIKDIGTNHYGQCYSFGNYNCCPKCPPYKRPTIWECIEEMPKDMKRPANWKRVKLGDIATFDVIK